MFWGRLILRNRLKPLINHQSFFLIVHTGGSRNLLLVEKDYRYYTICFCVYSTYEYSSQKEIFLRLGVQLDVFLKESNYPVLELVP